ncbi:response regulator [Flavobacterium sp. CYK-55]|uniref:response regulator n=1 Tax=Flavobacterium sp. CYK-55 TaxID=2835529 RepID=UPI001BCFAFC8|nr:response regulator [Flavobacterium sp. CYK-55]MBS7788091.1 response regulator [Flavobacterium sp. CYK-55]
MSTKPKLDCILLVDDDSATNFINEITIRKAGIKSHIQICNSAQKALDFLSCSGEFSHVSSPPQPGMILLDINMPGMSGWDFLEHYENIPNNQKAKMIVVMLTTSMNPDDRKRSEGNENIKSFIPKPLAQDHLIQIIEENFDHSM